VGLEEMAFASCLFVFFSLRVLGLGAWETRGAGCLIDEYEIAADLSSVLRCACLTREPCVAGCRFQFLFRDHLNEANIWVISTCVILSKG